LKEGKLSSEMQKKIVDGVEITPEEVEIISKNTSSRFTVFGVELEVAQIVVTQKFPMPISKK
jgi:peptidyl-prolyl cis-trans isomerase SurA